MSRSEILDRLPPQNLEAELGVLGSMLLDPETVDDVVGVVRSQDFYARANQTLFEQITAMRNEAIPVDMTLLVERLRKHKLLDAVGGMVYLERVLESVPTTANAVWYAGIVREHAMLRELIRAGTAILREAYDHQPGTSTADLLGKAEASILAIRASDVRNEPVTLAAALQDVLDEIDTRQKRKSGNGIKTGFERLDYLTAGGFRPGNLVILAARPGHGKSALAGSLAMNVATVAGQPVLFVSLEMSRGELVERMLSSEARLSSHRMKTGMLNTDEHRVLVEHYSRMSAAPIFFDDTPTIRVGEIAAKARRMNRDKQLGLVVIDYLQLIEPDDPREIRQEQVSRISRNLKHLAKELRCPVLCLAQLNRQADGGRPRLSHLRESGAIEQDADMVLFIDRPSAEKPREEQTNEATLIVAKHRNGPTGDIALHYEPEFTRFSSIVNNYHDDFQPAGRYGDINNL